MSKYFSTMLAVAVPAAMAGASCKVPLSNVNAEFTIADVSWFAEEQTLFIFYEVNAEQGIGPQSLLELTYTTDEGEVPWTPLEDFESVHTHEPVNCGVDARCGSQSVHVRLEPRDVDIRLRYHVDGVADLRTTTTFNVVGPGPAHSNRSLLIYGVFDETNKDLQWRSRHRFPTIRNQEATRLGLRRRFTIDTQRYGPGEVGDEDNLYAYADPCPRNMTALDWEALETEERAIFVLESLPDAAADAPLVCANATVFDPTGPFAADAAARKNPEVRPAFPLLRSPVRDATQLKYMLQICDRNISGPHRRMQRQRLLLEDIEPICLDGFEDGSVTRTLIARFRDDIERTRAEGQDMVLVMSVHHDVPAIRAVLEEALDAVLREEIDRNTPRVAGAFVFDSFTHMVGTESLERTVLWCPSEPIDEDDINNLLDGGFTGIPPLASLGCAIIPDNPTLRLGPFELGAIPIFPDRSIYLDFIRRFSEDQAGKTRRLRFRTPELAATARHIEVEPFGVATFLNDEVITADPDDAFSFCETDEFDGFVFEVPAIDDLPDLPDFPEIPPLLPISQLPGWHGLVQDSSYRLGIVWDFPFLMRIDYELIIATSVSAFSASVPFGVPINQNQRFGSELWRLEEIPLAESLAQCTRFCDHPVFDSAGVYKIDETFREDYLAACYRPLYPERPGDGFPLDP